MRGTGESLQQNDPAVWLDSEYPLHIEEPAVRSVSIYYARQRRGIRLGRGGGRRSR